MSHKINANAMRLGISKDWKSKWYAKGQDYTDQLHEDLMIREVISDSVADAGLGEIEIMRPAGKITIDVYVARPGVAIGRGGSGIEELTNKLKKVLDDNIEIKIKEVSNPDASAQVIAREIQSGLLRRMPSKLLALSAIQKAKAAGVKGIRVWVSGRINGAAQARLTKYSDGPVPLHTLKADIDFASVPAETNNLGKFGIKVWVYKGDIATTQNNNESK